MHAPNALEDLHGRKEIDCILTLTLTLTVKVSTRLAHPSTMEDLHGRKAIDCMLNLALAGVGCEGNAMFETLSAHGEAEIRRWG